MRLGTRIMQPATITPGPDWRCACGRQNDYLRTRCYGCGDERELTEIKPEPAPWRPMQDAPKDGPIVWIRAQLEDGTEVDVHWAQDLSGEEQPPFRGWYAAHATPSAGFYEVKPLRWKPIE